MEGDTSELHRECCQVNLKRERSHSIHTDRGSPQSPFLRPALLHATANSADETSLRENAAVTAANNASSHSPRVVLFELVPVTSCLGLYPSEKLRFGVEGLRIGRDPSCSDLVLNSAPVSRLHCVLSVLGDEVLVHDSSFNGTFVNGKRVGRGRCAVLHPRDIVSFLNPTCANAELYSFEFAPLVGHASPSFPTIEGMQRYEMGPVIGQGSFATVRLATDRETGDAVAVKLTERRRLCSEAAVAAASLHTEIEMMRGMDHPNIVRVLDAFEGSGCTALVMEYVRSGDLFDYIVGRGRNPFTETEARHLFVQLLEALRYIHGRGIIHCDLKPENVLVDVVDRDGAHQPANAAQRPASGSGSTVRSSAVDALSEVALSAPDNHQNEAKSLSPFDVQLKVTDFGVAKYAGGAAEEAAGSAAGEGGGGGTPVYAAPELAYFHHTELSAAEDDVQSLASAPPPSARITSAVDIWSLGVLLYILCSGTVPKPPPPGSSVVLHRCMGHLSASCTDLITRMMVTDPMQRISLGGICHHPWLDGVELRGGLRCNDDDDSDDQDALSATVAVAARGKEATPAKAKKGAVHQS